jgi:DNA-binding NarL/FixJ family response regulator
MPTEKKKQVLIVESRETFRKGLCAIFAEEPGGVEIVIATTSAECANLIEHRHFDLIVVHQSLLTENTRLPQGNVVILTTVPDVRMLAFAYRSQARAYLQEGTPGFLLRQLLYFPPGTFLNDSAVSALIAEHQAHHILFSVEKKGLTPREQEVFQLLLQGESNRAIARRLGMSENTLKTYVKEIYKRLRMNRRQIRMLALMEPEEQG